MIERMIIQESPLQNKSNIDYKRRLGKYYTPKPLAEALVDWAIRTPTDTFLDPCFGSCSFLASAMEILVQRGSTCPGRYIYGVDIDPEARRYLDQIIDGGAISSHFLTKDFLSLRYDDLPGAPFQVICGNPPFVRYHLLSKDMKNTAFETTKNSNLSFSRKSSYWAYFLLHCLHFLKKGGRIALILPIAFLYADYAELIRKEISKIFETIVIVTLKFRIFKEEVSVLVLFAEGFSHRNKIVRFFDADDIVSLKNCFLAGKVQLTPINEDIQNQWNRVFVSDEALRLYSDLLNRKDVIRLEELGRIRIGVVTGANEFFIISEEKRIEKEFPRDFFKPIISRANYLKGLKFDEKDVSNLSQNRQSLLLFCDCAREIPTTIHEYITQAEQQGIDNRFKCRMRKSWYRILDTNPPDAFFQYMSERNPHIVVNESYWTCTNTIHRITWKKEIAPDMQKAIALSSVSSLSQLSIELVGRSYGGGVLKLEPKKVKSIQLVLPQPRKNMLTAFNEADYHIRNGDIQMANSIADEEILRNFLCLKEPEISILRGSWKKLLKLRKERSSKRIMY